MFGYRWKKVARISTILMLFVIAIMLRRVHDFGIDTLTISDSFTRHVIYYAICIGWGYSLYTRIIQKNERRILMLMAFMLLFWMVLRTARYQIINDESTSFNRYLWYMYYIPIITIPHLFLLLTISMDRGENYRFPMKLYITSLFSFFLIILVLTNNYHQQVFEFTTEIWNDDDIRYGIGYRTIYGWIILQGVTGLYLLYKQSKISVHRRVIWIPFIPIIIMIFYTVLYAKRVPVLMYLLGDMTSFFCVMYMIVIEACIYIRFIPSNTNYQSLFKISAAPLSILDNNFESYLSSALFEKMDKEILKVAVDAPQICDKERLSCYSIRGGYVYWRENLKDLLDLFDRLEETKEELLDNNEVLQNEYIVESRKKRIETLNQLYDLIQEQTKDQIDFLSEKIAAFEAAKDPVLKRQLMEQMLIVGAYLKRRNNLILALRDKEWVSSHELYLSIKETFDCLQIMGVDCHIKMNYRKPFKSSDLLILYDFFQGIVEESFSSLETMLINVREISGNACLTMILEGDIEFPVGESEFSHGTRKVIVKKEEDGAWLLRHCLLDRGELS